VASATAVTTVGAVVGVAAGSEQGQASDAEATAAEATLLEDIPAGSQAQVQTASLTQQADTASSAAEAEARKSAAEAARKKAAKDAAAKKAKAEKEAAAKEAAKKAKEREKIQTASSRSDSRADAGDFTQKGSYSTAEVQSMAKQIVGGGQYQCFSEIVKRESGWNYRATNASSGAYGLVLALPGSKMAWAGAEWRTNPATNLFFLIK
jgi:hypothetical protein